MEKPEPDAEKKATNKDETSSTLKGVLQLCGLFYLHRGTVSVFNVAADTFVNIALRNFPETEHEKLLTKQETEKVTQAVSTYNACEKEGRNDCVSIYLAEIDQTYFKRVATTREMKFINAHKKIQDEKICKL